jgi:4-oxalocrotonate tautomerase
MPLVEIKVFEDELSGTEPQDVITRVTDAIVSVTGEVIRPHTWVVISQVSSGHWGIGGNALGLTDVRALQRASDHSNHR